MAKKKISLHDALTVVAEKNVDYLSYEGQTKWNELSRRYSSRMRKVS